MSFSTNAAATMRATTFAARTASPSCETRAAPSANFSARSGSPGATMPNASMKICAPLCSDTIFPLRFIEPDSGDGTPCLRRIHAVCSVESETPPHQRIVRFSIR